MPSTANLTVQLANDLHEFVTKSVAAGEYESASAMVAEALENLRVGTPSPQFSDEELIKLWDEGIASGPGKYQDIEEILAEAHRRYEATQRNENTAYGTGRS